MGKYIITAAFALTLLIGGCASINDAGTRLPRPDGSWTFVYANDAEGHGKEGSKDDLISAIRAGKQVRIYTKGRRIEHVYETQILSVFDGEVFAQIAAIESQRPAVDPPRIFFRDPGVKWRAILGTNGFFTAFMDGKEPNVRKGGARWFVQN